MLRVLADAVLKLLLLLQRTVALCVPLIPTTAQNALVALGCIAKAIIYSPVIALTALETASAFGEGWCGVTVICSAVLMC